MKPDGSAPDPLYCSMYIDGPLQLSALRELVAHVMGGSINAFTVEAPCCFVSIYQNDEFRDAPREQRSDFVFYRYRAEIEPREPIVRTEYISAIGRLLTHLWSRNMGAVAACDFEDELPRMPG